MRSAADLQYGQKPDRVDESTFMLCFQGLANSKIFLEAQDSSAGDNLGGTCA